MRLRGSRARSTRGHVRVEEGRDWQRWIVVAVALIAIGGVLVVLAAEFVLPALQGDTQTSSNRTWFEFDPWALALTEPDSARLIAERLQENQIDRIYVEAAAWLSDGTLEEGPYAADFADKLRKVDADLSVLLWLRMSNEQIDDSVLRERALSLAQQAVFDWGFDGVQLNSWAISRDDEAFVQMIRDLRAQIGGDAVLSVAVPPDRIPSDPNVPIGMEVAPELTWDMNFKQRIGLLQVDEMVIMAYAAGLESSEAYETWVAYQIESYVEALTDLNSTIAIVVAVPTYDAAPGHNPAIESVRAAIRGVAQGRDRIEAAEDVDGVGLYIYSATDSLEWALYRETWLGEDAG